MTAVRVEPLRIGVALDDDPLNPGVWSGTPHGIITGLNEIGVDVVSLSGRPGRCFGRAASIGLSVLRAPRMGQADFASGYSKARETLSLSPLFSPVTNMQIARAQSRASHLDAVIQLGSSFRVRHPLVVTFEDMTVKQARHHGFAPWEDVPASEYESRVSAQGHLYRRAFACCAATPWAARSIIDEYAVPESKVHAIGLGVNHVVQVLERDWSIPRFLFVGRDWKRKNGERVLRAFARVRAVYPDARLDVVGAHWASSGPGITVHGETRLGDARGGSVVESLLRQATCLVVPSVVEPAGIVYLEAAAAGVPSIGTTVGGAAALIGDGGLAVAPDDERQIFEAMLRMCDSTTAREAGNRARARADDFTWPNVAARLLDALRLNGERPAVPLPWPKPA